METLRPDHEVNGRYPYPPKVTREEVLARLALPQSRSAGLSYQEAKAGLEEEQKAEWRRVHDLYLHSPKWRAIRSRIMDRAKGLCEGCRLATAAEVHHHTYEHVGDEFMFELAALCPACHERYHRSKRRWRSWS